MSDPLVLILGGRRSGKSRFAQRRAIELADDRPVTFVGTAWRGDPEMDERIRSHGRARPASWPVVEVGADLAGPLAGVAGNEPLLLDGLTLWLSGAFDAERSTVDQFADGPFADALAVLTSRPGPGIVVSDEINMGLMALDAPTRAFCDLIGIVHQRLAQEADEAYLMVAGLPLALKDG